MEQERFEDFASAIAGLYRDIQRIKARYSQQLDVRSVHVFWLYLLLAHPQGLTASELARKGKSTRALVSREIQELTDRGLIQPDRHTDRRRYGWKFILTPKGEDLARRIGSIALDIQTQAGQDIPPEDLAVFYRTLHTLLTNFDRLADSLGKDHHDEG